jgi:hypothetical protein
VSGRRPLLGVLALLLLLLLAAAPAATAGPAGTTCTPPRLPGFKVLSLRTARLSCATARTNMRETINRGAAHGYRCHHEVGPGSPVIGVTCHRRGAASQWFAGDYRSS